jgi:CubicO group peptidase (beta-lactamase class C family)
MSPRTAIAFLTIAFLGARPASAQSPFGELERVVQSHMRQHAVPGAAVAIVRGDSVVYASGFGVASSDSTATVTPDVLFQAGSATKMLTAALLATLAQRGTLRLDASIGNYVSGLAPAIARVTAHQLLSQSAGIRDEEAGDGQGDESALAAYARSWTDAYSILPPGLVFSYSNPGYALAGLVAQEAARRPFAELVREHVLAPVGMERTSYRPPPQGAIGAAVGHSPPPGAPPNAEARPVRPHANDTRFWPAGYAFTSARDLARFAIALMNRGRIDGRQALPSAATTIMLTRHIEVPNIFLEAGYGYGLFLGPYRGERSAWHDGQMPGFGAMIRLLPERRLGVVVLLNRSGVRSDAIVDAAFDVLGVRRPAPPLPSRKPIVAMTAGDVERLAGRYENRFAVELIARNGALYRQWFGQEERVYRVGDHRFTVDSTGANRLAEFSIVPATAGRQGYVQLFLWAFPRRDR